MSAKAERKLKRKRLRIFGDNPTCLYCGRELSRRNRTLDHLVPQSRGGGNRYENLAPACGPCNRAKSDRTPAEWAHDILIAAARFELSFLMPDREGGAACLPR